VRKDRSMTALECVLPQGIGAYALAAHVYPTSMRATGVAYSSTVGRAGGLLSSLFGASVIQAGLYFQALAIAMVCAFAGLAWVRGHFPGVGKLEVPRAVDIP
jgi:AAHS family 4-hydroxybenzoate transporter-like MFS transporter